MLGKVEVGQNNRERSSYHLRVLANLDKPSEEALVQAIHVENRELSTAAMDVAVGECIAGAVDAIGEVNRAATVKKLLPGLRYKS